MGKASRNKRQSAREKIAAQQAAARRAQMRNRMLITGGAVVVVIAVVVALIVVKAMGNSPASAKSAGSTEAATVVNTVTHVPAATLDKVGAGTGQTNKPKAVPGSTLTENGKPEVLYMGAEYCPFCAAERWSMAVALSRFGTFSNVGLIHSSSSDIYPSTPTLTFYKSSYTSKYLTFTPVEMQTVSHATLQKPTAQQNALLSKYDAAPYLPKNSPAGAIPFIDIANKYALVGGSSYIPQVLHGLSWTKVAHDLANPASSVAKQADGAANYLTAAICKVTGNKPANVCGTSMIKTLQGKI